MVTIKDVARESGVAISTVSNVLNEVDIVSPETKKRVLLAVEKLKYVPNMNAKYLRSTKKNTIGLFLPSIQGDFYKTLMQSVHLQCKLNGYMLNIYVSNENTSEEIYGMIISSGVQGIILLNELLHDEYIERIAVTKLPMVLIDREHVNSHVSSIVIDNYYGSSLAVEHLIKLGHRRIGYIHGIHNYDDESRYKAYLDVMNKYQLPIDDKLVLRGYFEESGAYSATRVLIMQGVELPDAMFCANDEMAWGCIQAITEVGIRVPEQVSVIGFDDITLAAYYSPAITTIHSPVTELGSTAATEVIRLMKAEEPAKGIFMKLEPTLIVRDSCNFRL